MHQQRQSLRFSKANEEKNSGIIDSNAESPSTVSKSQPKKSSQSSILGCKTRLMKTSKSSTS
ncbi:hypothetical protein Tco_1222256, partial [Tanacetum coccineum]